MRALAVLLHVRNRQPGAHVAPADGQLELQQAHVQYVLGVFD